MHATSLAAAISVRRQFDARVVGVPSEELNALFDDLSGVAALFEEHHHLRYALAHGTDPDEKAQLVDRLFDGKISVAALDVVRAAVREEWSSSEDLVGAIERFANWSLLIAAERAGRLENVEDELFRFGKVLEANSELAAVLDEQAAPLEARLRLLEQVIAGKVDEITAKLLRRAVSLRQLYRGQSIDRTVAFLAALAAGRREESVAHVLTPTELSESQVARLKSVLSRIYGRGISVQAQVDPDVLGGLHVTVGDEVIDGTVASRLAEAAERLPV
jgi:F-type H+-transporting ATPase subunit delta